MKFAVISDIHGNMFALDAVLEDIKLHNVDKIFCLGDLAMAGPEPNKTIDYIKNQDWTIIQGNTDYMIVNFSEDLFQKVASNAPIMANALKYDVKEITAENVEYLKNLPAQKSIELDGVKILLVHGSPRKNDENIFPDLSMKKIEEIVENVAESVIFCGHTHIPCGYQTNSKKTIVNVGSVGRPFTENPQACYVLAEAVNGQLLVEHHMVNYDKVSASKMLAKQDFDGATKLAQMLINPETRHM